MWLCWFSEQHINTYLGSKTFKEFAPWIKNLLPIFYNDEDIELHVVVPNIFTNTNMKFTDNGITYHYYKTSFLLPSRVYNKLKINQRTDYKFINKEIYKITNLLNPELIHLHGAENPIYSSAILKLIDKYPVLTTIQGFINQEGVVDNDIIKYRKVTEAKILRKCHHFGVRTTDMELFIKEFNSHAQFHWHNYPITKPTITNAQTLDKVYDCSFFGRVAPENGIEELLKSIYIIKQELPLISLIVVGPIPQSYSDHLKKIVSGYNISDNVTFSGFLENQHDAFEIVSKATVNVLPTHYDIIPGSILECMYMGVPVITNAVGGIPELNEDKICVHLSEDGKPENLAKDIQKLLRDKSYRNTLIENARNKVTPFIDGQQIKTDLLSIYKKIIETYHGK